jgi:hypothetical protein
MQIYLQFSEREYLQGSKRLKDSANERKNIMSPLIRDDFKAGIPSAAYLQGSKRLKDTKLSEE